MRRRSVIELAERCNYWPEHANQVARLALALFDQTRGMHGLTDREREWLEYAALLHDIGVHISYEAAPQAFVLPDQERRSARLRARRDRDDRADGALSPARDAEAAPRGLQRADGRSDGASFTLGGDPAARRKPRSQPLADDHRASSSTIAATTRCCRCGRRATPSSSSGPRRGTRRRSSG